MQPQRIRGVEAQVGAEILYFAVAVVAVAVRIAEPGAQVVGGPFARPAHRGRGFSGVITAVGQRGLTFQGLAALLGDDVDHAAGGVVPVQHRAAAAAHDFDARDTLDGDQIPVRARQIGQVDPAAIHQQ